jgi:hypothetical protein
MEIKLLRGIANFGRNLKDLNRRREDEAFRIEDDSLEGYNDEYF